MSESSIKAELAALRQAAIEDIEALSDAEMRQELESECGNVDAHLCGLKSAMRDAAAQALRDQLIVAKTKVQGASDRSVVVAKVRPTIETIKRLITELMRARPSVGLAFRDGKKQTDEDWQTTYDDLVEMGLLKSQDNDHRP